jgi:hypothetical protein
MAALLVDVGNRLTHLSPMASMGSPAALCGEPTGQPFQANADEHETVADRPPDDVTDFRHRPLNVVPLALGLRAQPDALLDEEPDPAVHRLVGTGGCM